MQIFGISKKAMNLWGGKNEYASRIANEIAESAAILARRRQIVKALCGPKSRRSENEAKLQRLLAGTSHKKDKRTANELRLRLALL